MKPTLLTDHEGEKRENDWLENSTEILSKEELTVTDAVSMAAYRTLQVLPTSFQLAMISLLPLFYENAHTVAMILHAVNVIKSAVKYDNATQVPIIGLMDVNEARKNLFSAALDFIKKTSEPAGS